MSIPIRSWFIGLGGLFLGCMLFAFDTMVERLSLGPPHLHYWIESFEFALVGPGLGLTCLLLAERFRIARETSRLQMYAERERRFLVLGRMAASVAHEVRNPLHTLRLVMDELRMEQPALRNHALGAHIDDSLERIDRAVDLVYRLARPEAEDDSAGDLVATVVEAKNTLEMRLSDRSVVLRDLPSSAPVRCSASGLRIMIDNLLRNAGEATSADGVITVTIHAETGRWRLRITNPGQLINLPATTTIETSADIPRKSSGLGLGLTITRYLADGVGGRVVLTSQGGVVTADLILPAWKEER